MERPFDVPQDLYPFTSRWLEVEGLPVHYVDEGEGPALLFLHGNPTWSFLYRDVIRALRDRFRCLALDYPGMGMSAKPRDVGRDDYGFTPAEHSRVVEGFVDALDLEDLTLMVQDWGGPIGIGFATRRPERVARLVIGNTWAWPAEEFDMKLFSAMFGLGPGRFAVTRFNVFIERLLPMGCERELAAEVMAAYRAPFPTPADRVPIATFARSIVKARPFLTEVVQNLDAVVDKPVQIIWGKKDRAFRKRELERWKRIFPDARVRVLDDAGHFIQEDAAGAIVEEIGELMAQKAE